LATVHEDGTVRIWDAADGDLRHTFSGHTSKVWALDWAPDSTGFATVGADGTARVVQLIEGGVREVLTLSNRDSRNGLFGVAFSPDGDRLMTGDGAITAVTVWDVSPLGGAELANFANTADARDLFTREGELLVSAPGRGSAIWDLEEGSPRLEVDTRALVDDDVYEMALSPDGELLATSSGGLPIELWDAETGEHHGSVAPEGLDAYVEDLAWSPDGDHLALGLGLFNTDDDTLGATVVFDREGTEMSRLIEGPHVFVASAAFSGDGRSIVTSQVSERRDPAESGFGVWDWRKGELEDHVRANPVAVDADPVHARVAAVDELDGSAEVWDLDRKESIATFRRSGSLDAVDFRADGEQLAFAGADGTIGLGDPDTGEQQMVLRGSQSSVVRVSFSPDGTRLASMGTDGVLRVWALDLDELIEIARGRLTRSLDDDECRQWLHLDACPKA
jgi:WD40 repeat protein